MALSDKRIIEEMKKGNVVIEPFNRKNLATSSYDVRLGEWYFRENRPKHIYSVYNIYDKRHTDHVWGTKPLRAEKAKEVFKDVSFDFVGISPEDKVILIEPGETILAHTEEFIGGRNHVTTDMKARSSIGRNFIEVCKCAGWGDVGYTNRWTMEITNISKYYSIPLVVGRRIAQIIFFETGEIESKDYTKIETSKYHTESDIKKMIKSWKPEMMLPRLYKDWEIKK